MSVQSYQLYVAWFLFLPKPVNRFCALKGGGGGGGVEGQRHLLTSTRDVRFKRSPAAYSPEKLGLMRLYFVRIKMKKVHLIRFHFKLQNKRVRTKVLQLPWFNLFCNNLLSFNRWKLVKRLSQPVGMCVRTRCTPPSYWSVADGLCTLCGWIFRKLLIVSLTTFHTSLIVKK